MADEPTTPDHAEPVPPDPERDLDRAGDAAARAADDIADAPTPDPEAAAALAAAMEAVNLTRQSADAATAGSSPAPAKAPPAPTGPANAGKAPKPDAADAAPFRLQDLIAPPSGGRKETLDLLADVQLNVRIELGRTRMYVEDVLQLGDGAVVELDKLAGDPVDVFVNDRHVARGEVLVLNDNFCVRINEILDPGAERAG